jgi:DNA-binding transcriptional ArsR family regulator
MSQPFFALADPTRRAILDRLRTSGPLSLSALAAELPMTRQAVTKHVRALEAGGLIRSRMVGRERIHTLDPAPLRSIEEWLRPYSEEWDRRLDRLEKHLTARPGLPKEESP